MKIRLAFCGAGNMGQAAHLRNYAQLHDQCEIVAVSDMIPGRAAAVAARYGIPRAYESDEELLAGNEVDAIVAMRPFMIHGQVLPPVIAAGKPFIVEKPLASSVAVGKRLLEAIEASGARCMVAYHKRSDPATMWGKAEADRIKASGELGKMRLVKVIMPPGDWIAGGFGELVTAGGEWKGLVADPGDPDYDAATQDKYLAFVNYYIHQVNLLRHLLGESYAFEYVDPTEVIAVGRSASGVACSLEMAPYNATHAWHEQAWVCFERGYVKIELPAPLTHNRPGRVTVFRDPGEGKTPMTCSPDLLWRDAMMQQAHNFLAFARGDAPAPSDAAEALLDLEQAKEYMQILNGRNR